MEHIVASNIMQYAEDIIAPEQYGFTCGCSSETQLHGLIDPPQGRETGRPCGAGLLKGP